VRLLLLRAVADAATVGPKPLVGVSMSLAVRSLWQAPHLLNLAKAFKHSVTPRNSSQAVPAASFRPRAIQRRTTAGSQEADCRSPPQTT